VLDQKERIAFEERLELSLTSCGVSATQVSFYVLGRYVIPKDEKLWKMTWL
jgi:hypothetical protein